MEPTPKKVDLREDSQYILEFTWEAEGDKDIELSCIQADTDCTLFEQLDCNTGYRDPDTGMLATDDGSVRYVEMAQGRVRMEVDLSKVTPDVETLYFNVEVCGPDGRTFGDYRKVEVSFREKDSSTLSRSFQIPESYSELRYFILAVIDRHNQGWNLTTSMDERCHG